MLREKNYFFTDETRLAEAIEMDPGLVPVIDRFNIPLGLLDNTVKDICNKHLINKDVFLFIANLYVAGQSQSQVFIDENGLSDLLLYLKNSHNEYFNEMYPAIKNMIFQVQAQNDDPAVKMVGHFFEGYMNEVEEHFKYEDEIVFPYITDLINGTNTSNLIFSVQEYKEHHDDIEEKLSDLKSLLIKYLPVQDDGRARRKLLEQLFVLESDLHIHSLVEDTVLIPIVEKLEKVHRPHDQ